MKFKLLEYTLSPMQLEVLLDQYNTEKSKKEHDIKFFPIQKEQINLFLLHSDFRLCKDIVKNQDGVRSIVNTDYRLAVQAGYDYKLFYNIMAGSSEEDQDHWPMLIGYENNDGLFWKIEAVY